MQIAEVESILVGHAHFVRIRTDDGLCGLGQSGCWAYPEAVHSVVRVFRSYLLGQDPGRIEHHWQHLYRTWPFRGSVLGGAVNAVDIALWDLKGKALGAPIVGLLGGRCRERIRLHLLLEGETPDEIAANARGAAEEGFTALKFDPLPAGYEDMTLPRLVATVAECLVAAREAVGADVDLILELHRKLTPLQFLPLADALAFRPLFVEDPIQIDSIASQAELARRLALPLALGERLHTIWEFRELLAHGGSQFCRPDLGLAGGITHCKKIAVLAEAYHAALVTHNFLGPVLTAAALHLDASIPNFLVQEYSLFDEGSAAAAFSGVPKREGGYLPVPEAPGLGVELDESIAASLSPIDEGFWDIPLRADGSVAYAV